MLLTKWWRGCIRYV